MSTVFYDNLIVFGEVEDRVKSIAHTKEERDELWQIIDEIIHHKAMGIILDKLPREFHEEFLGKFHKAPHDEQLLVYLQDKIGKNIEEVLRQELGNLAFEILKDIEVDKKPKSG